MNSLALFSDADTDNGFDDQPRSVQTHIDDWPKHPSQSAGVPHSQASTQRPQSFRRSFVIPSDRATASQRQNDYDEEDDEEEYDQYQWAAADSATHSPMRGQPNVFEQLRAFGGARERPSQPSDETPRTKTRQSRVRRSTFPRQQRPGTSRRDTKTSPIVLDDNVSDLANEIDNEKTSEQNVSISAPPNTAVLPSSSSSSSSSSTQPPALPDPPNIVPPAPVRAATRTRTTRRAAPVYEEAENDEVALQELRMEAINRSPLFQFMKSVAGKAHRGIRDVIANWGSLLRRSYPLPSDILPTPTYTGAVLQARKLIGLTNTALIGKPVDAFIQDEFVQDLFADVVAKAIQIAANPDDETTKRGRQLQVTGARMTKQQNVNLGYFHCVYDDGSGVLKFSAERYDEMRNDTIEQRSPYGNGERVQTGYYGTTRSTVRPSPYGAYRLPYYF